MPTVGVSWELIRVGAASAPRSTPGLPFLLGDNGARGRAFALWHIPTATHIRGSLQEEAG